MKNLQLTPEQIKLLKSCVGLDRFPEQKEEFYRNRFIVNSESVSNLTTILHQLCELKLMAKMDPRPVGISSIEDWYYLTDAGLREVVKYAKHKDTFSEQPQESR